MQPLARIADEFGQAALDVEVHVLEVDRPAEDAVADLLLDRPEAFLDALQGPRQR